MEKQQIVHVLNLVDNTGNTALLKIGSETLSGSAFVKWKKVLSLFGPDDETKREYLIRQNYLGVCAFDNASSRICYMKTVDGEDLFRDAWNPGYKLQRAAKRAITSKQWLVWCIRYLKRKKSKFVEDVKLLVPLFYVAALKYDVLFAELILSKIDSADKEAVETFMRTTAMDEQATVFHFAARNMKISIMKALVDRAKSANLNLFDLLSMRSEDGSDDTPLIVAVKNDRYRIIKYLLSEVIPERATEIILMATEMAFQLNINNFFKSDEHVIEWNAVICALATYSQRDQHQRDLSVLKLLMKGCRDFKQLLDLFTYSNAVNESIYHYMLTKEVCLYFQEVLGVNFNMKAWGTQDSDGVTPLMRAMKLYERDHSMISNDDNMRTNDKAVEFLEWIFNDCCINDAQRLWLIYRTAGDGENLLDKTSGAVQRYLVNQVELMLSNKSNFDLESLIPIWLFALKESDIDLAKRLIVLVKDGSRRLELVGCRNEFGSSPLLAAALGGHLKTLRFLEQQFQAVDWRNFIEHRDHKGRTVMHYAVKSGSREMVKEVLSLYMEGSEKTLYSDLMIESLKDEMGNTPFSYFLKENGSDEMALYLLNRFDDKAREEQRAREAVASASGTRSKRRVTYNENVFSPQENRSQSSVGSIAQNIEDKLQMLFSKNKNGEIPLIEEYATEKNMPTDIVSDHVYEFISSIKSVHMENVEMVGYCLLFAVRRGAMARMKLIIEKINGDDDMLNEVLRVRNRSGHDALYRMVATGKMRQFSWLLDRVPNDHLCLYSRSLLRGDTVFMRLLELGQLSLAAKLLGKITDNEVKSELLMAERLKRFEGGGSAVDIAKRKKIEPVIEWLNKQIELASELRST